MSPPNYDNGIVIYFQIAVVAEDQISFDYKGVIDNDFSWIAKKFQGAVYRYISVDCYLESAIAGHRVFPHGIPAGRRFPVTGIIIPANPVLAIQCRHKTMAGKYQGQEKFM
jgi:hypothetical protein